MYYFIGLLQDIALNWDSIGTLTSTLPFVTPDWLSSVHIVII